MGGIIKSSRNTVTAPRDLVATQTVAFSHYNNISAQLPLDVNSGKIVEGGVKEQAEQCLKNIKAIVESIDHAMHDVIKINVYLKNIKDLDIVDDVYATFFPRYLPTRTVMSVAALPMDAVLVQMDAVISNGEGSGTQAPCDLVKIARNTANAPNSDVSTQTVAFSHYNHISAQLPLDPKTGNIIAGGVKEQTGQCLKNIKSILEAIDVPADDIVKINIYLENLADIEAINEIYSRYFPDSAIARTCGYMPARSVIVVEGLPMGALVQIDATVSHGDGTPPQAVEDRHGLVIKANNTHNAPQMLLSTQTVAFSHYSNISAQLPLNSMTGNIVDGGVNEQARQCLTNIKAIVESVNHVMDDIVKVNIQLKNMADLDAVNDVYTTFFNDNLPARTTIGVSAIAMDALVQMDAIVSNAEGTPPEV
ncbi:RidA family protein [Photobacterium carnosum]|uniref:RidA family protein n=1 Tax=Photobacterium carnosum TaxID=2023717 RepID=UPI001E56D3ED|nr:RidA family protein [Photobacterium carnosum]MCD9516273.1 reactive intermediate/imine deaminase [Photobacterium carnosum]